MEANPTFSAVVYSKNYHIRAGLESGTLMIGNVSKFNVSLSVCNLTQS